LRQLAEKHWQRDDNSIYKQGRIVDLHTDNDTLRRQIVFHSTQRTNLPNCDLTTEIANELVPRKVIIKSSNIRGGYGISIRFKVRRTPRVGEKKMPEVQSFSKDNYYFALLRSRLMYL